MVLGMSIRQRLRFIARLSLSLLVVPLFALVLSASPASASGPPAPNTSGVQTGLICGSGEVSATTATDNLLPVNRWSGALGNEHTRLPGGFLSGITNAGSEINRGVFVGGMTSIGAAEWQLGVAANEAASQFCFANTVGQDANSLAATLGNAISKSGLLAILAVFALLGALWRASRGRENPVREIGKFVVVAAIFVAIVVAATNSSGTNYQPLSPAWLVQTVYNTVSNVASAPASAISSAANKIVGGSSATTIAKSDPLSCSWYTQELVAQYQKAYTATNSYGYMVPVSLNALWEQAALPAYTAEQFGASNNYGLLVYCHLLEDQAGIDPSSQKKIALASGALSGDTSLSSYGPTQASALAWNGAITNDQEDESLVAWAACQSPSKGSDHSGFTPTEWNTTTGAAFPKSQWSIVQNTTASANGASTNSDTTVSGADCQVFWSANAPATGGQFGDAAPGGPFTNPSGAPWPGQISNPDYSVFNWSDNPTSIANATMTAAATSPNLTYNGTAVGDGMANYLNNLHGTSNANAEATSFIFLLSSSVIMVIFLILSLAVIIAKLSLLLSMMVLPAMLILAMLPGGAGNGKFAAYAKHLLGLVLFATCAGVLLAFIAIITGMLADIGVSASGQGSLMSLIWVTIAPVAAIWMVHVFFKKVLRAPSPFKPTSAMAYGAALGGFGGVGAVAGFDIARHMRRQGGKAVSGARSRFTGGAQATGTGQRGGRGGGRHSMGGSRGPGSGGPGAGVAGDVGEVVVGAGVGAASQSMFKTGSRQRRVETEQHLANRHAAGERVTRVTKRASKFNKSMIEHGGVPGMVSAAAKTRIKESLTRTKDRFEQRDEGTGKYHRVQGSLLTAGAVASAAGRGVKKIPKVAKYGVIGAAGLAAAGIGAPVLLGGAAIVGASKLRRYHRNAPVRQAQNLTAFRQHKADQETQATDATKAQEKADAKVVEDRQQAEQRTAEEQARAQAEQEQVKRDRAAAEQRVREWKSGNVGPPRSGPSSDGPQGPSRSGPTGPTR